MSFSRRSEFMLIKGWKPPRMLGLTDWDLHSPHSECVTIHEAELQNARQNAQCLWS